MNKNLYSEAKVTVAPFAQGVEFEGKDKEFLKATIFGRKEAKLTDNLKDIANYSNGTKKVVLVVGKPCSGRTTYVNRDLKTSPYFRDAKYISYDQSLKEIGIKHSINPYALPNDGAFEDKYGEELDANFWDEIERALKDTDPIRNRLIVIEGPFADIVNRAAIIIAMHELEVKVEIAIISFLPKSDSEEAVRNQKNIITSRALDITIAKRRSEEAEYSTGEEIYLYRKGFDKHVTEKGSSIFITLCELQSNPDFKNNYNAVKAQCEHDEIKNKFEKQCKIGVDRLGADIYYSVYRKERD